ncbi:hypothetical protein TWF718_009419 [Orbilia javanica]|uniref:UBC core domain-containing protein n=1 Tax=Orbilia javanica TaxID=47235 RepID=A0AAN8MT74_9PEZI
MSGSVAAQDQQTWTTLCQGDVVREHNDTLYTYRVLKTWHEIGVEDSQLDDASLHCHPSASPQVLNQYLKDNELARHHVILAASAYTNLIAHESALHLVDRPLAYGTIVKKSPRDLQSGTVLDIGGTYDVAHSFTTIENDETPCDPQKIIRGVSSEDIVFSREWEIGDYLIWNNCWLGEVVELIETVTICLGNNSVVTVEVPGQLKLKRTKLDGFPDPASIGSGTGHPPDANATFMGGIGAEVYALLDRFLPRDSSDEDEPFDFEIGQIVETSKGNLRRGKWRFGAYDPNVEPVGKVVEVRAISLCIEWICQNMMVRSRFIPIEPPEPWVSDGDEAWFQLKKFNRQADGGPGMKTINLERYDRVKFKDLDYAMEKYNSNSNGSSGVVEKVPRSTTLGYDVNEFMVLARSSWVKVQWQDLTITQEKSVDLIRCDSSDEHELWPGDFVITKPETGSEPQTLTAPPRTQAQPANAPNDNTNIGADGADPPLVFVSPERLGVIQSVDAARRIACVRWFKSPKVELAGEMIIPGSSTGALNEDTTEKVSMYEVAAHPALSICRGDFVLVAPEQVAEPEAGGPTNISSTRPSTSPHSPASATLTSATSQQSSIGAISEALRGIVDTGLIANLSASLINTTNPQLHTLSRMLHQFPLGLRSDLGQQLPAIAVPPINTSPDWFGEVVDKGLDGLVTVRLGALEEIRTIKVPIERLTVVFDGEGFDDDDEDELDDSVDMGSDDDSGDSGSDYSMEADDWISEQIFYEGGEPMEAGNEADWLTDEEDASDIEEMEVDDLVDGASPDTPTDPPNSKVEGSTIGSTVKDTSLNKASSKSPSRFGILEGAVPPDHAFVAQPALEQSVAFLRRINKEHKILQTSLPEGIFVRTWESRLDLLRVLIVGPRNTPYELAPFVFDFHLGPSFPSAPPTGYFHSWTNGIGRVNPNLYEDGKICLSLLGTWHGEKKSENWSSSGSSILQVLVSLMGLVLVKEPYYSKYTTLLAMLYFTINPPSMMTRVHLARVFWLIRLWHFLLTPRSRQFR